MDTLSNIFQTLDIDSTNGLYFTNDTKWKSELQFPSRIAWLLENSIKPDAFFCIDNKPLILFFENPPNKEKLHKDIWNFNETPIVIIIECGIVEIFNGFKLIEKGENKGLLSKIVEDGKLDDFTYFKLVTGTTWEKYQNKLSYKNRVDYKLLDNIKAARKEILDEFPKTDDEKIRKSRIRITNALLGKIIFVRYLIDREVILNFDGESKKWTPKEFCQLLQDPKCTQVFFDYLSNKETGFNGDLFPVREDEYKLIPDEAYKILIRLLQSQEIKTGQLSLFDLYDFSIIPTEFISNIYESFVGIENQAREGVYYTPLFLVDYILSKTVEDHINKNKSYNCKVLDSSCGSGVFLVETLRKLIEQYKTQNKETFENDKEKFKEAIKNIALENIFGIDNDESAVQVAIFSIYLTLLSEMNPPEISNFKFPPLLNTNFFCADFFDETKEFNTIFTQDNFKFDFIVGNPPWFRGQNEKKKTKQEPLYVQYIENRKIKEKDVEYVIDIGNKEIAQAFLLRSSDFCAENTKCALIVTSKVLYNLQSKKFRKYFLHNYLIERVLELAPVRREVFDKSNDTAIAPACVLFFSSAKGKNTDSNLIEHITLKPSRFFSMFKIFSIYRHDIQTVQQDRLKEYDWLWKVLVYGSYLDFNFIQRLKEEFITIKDVITQEKVLFKQGLKRKDGTREIKVTELKGKSFLDTQKGELQQFMIMDSNRKWENEYVGYIYKQQDKPYIELFQPYSLLIAEGVLPDFTSNAAISHNEKIFTSSIRVLKIQQQSELGILYNMNSILCSSLFAYYALNIASSVGIEREQTQDEEIERMWYLKIPDVITKAKKIEEYQHNKYTLKSQATKEISIRQQCDDIVLPFLNLTEVERELLNYANNITIPLQMKHKGHEKLLLPCNTNDQILNDYANLFIDRFAPNFEKIEKKFIVEIWHTNQIVGMFFKVIPQSEYTKQIVWVNKQTDTEILKTIIELGITKITDKLFIKKDIRGFEKDYFYVFKPNEKRLWHKAVGYLDVYEFLDAILKAGRDGK